jgi:hypothetical protein
MRLAIEEGHPWYAEDVSDYHVWLDGAELDDCVAASEEDGVVVVADIAAWLRMEGDAPAPTYERRGRVELVTWDEHNRRKQAQAA